MHGGRLNEKELEIIEQTRREGETYHAKGNTGKKVLKFYLWFVLTFVAIAAAIVTMMSLMPGK